jgi:hypothetical protein
MKMPSYAKIASVLVLALFLGAVTASAEPWKFGVMSDTQWKADADGQNPETVAVGIIEQLNRRFINHDVKFVIQVGDLVDKETNSPNGLPLDRTMDTRASAAQALYDAGIGFYPLRGNHEGSLAAALEFQALYSQTTGSGPHVFGASHFSSPSTTLNGLSYSFDYHNARFVILDQFTRTDGTNYLGNTNNNIIDQQGWIDMQLATRPGKTHAFVFSHKNLIGQNHTDSLLGSNPASNPDAQNAFIGSLAANGVRYHLGGHDHVHNRSIITSPDGRAAVQDIIASSNSYKFYIPQIPSNDAKYDVPAFGFSRETPIAQELFTVGYYLFTVDGPRVTVEHYAAPNGCDGDCDLVTTPTLTFTLRETFGYSLNGREFLVPQGAAYTTIEDGYHGTTARIVDGVNGSTAVDHADRPFIKTVDTGWSRRRCETASHVLTLWGMADLGSDKTDLYALTMTYDPDKARPEHLGRGLFGLVARDGSGDWVNAVDMNIGGTKKFVHGPWQPGYGLGTYGIDTRSKTVWAVINYNGDFAVSDFHQTLNARKDRDEYRECREEHEENTPDWQHHHEGRD